VQVIFILISYIVAVVVVVVVVVLVAVVGSRYQRGREGKGLGLPTCGTSHYCPLAILIDIGPTTKEETIEGIHRIEHHLTHLFKYTKEGGGEVMDDEAEEERGVMGWRLGGEGFDAMQW